MISDTVKVATNDPEDKSKFELKEVVESFAQQPKGFSVSYLIDYQALQIFRDKALGTGSYGAVYQGVWRNHTRVAVKELPRDISAEATQDLDTESQMMARLRSPYIVQFYGYCPSPRCIVMEYMPNGSLYSVLKNTEQALEWSIRIRIAIDMASGLSFLHDEQILHRDIKSPNVLLSESYGAKLTDFGLSKIKTESQLKSNFKDKVGTIPWMAPELFAGQAYTQKSDVYSLGMTLWELASRKIPYAENSSEAIPTFVREGKRETIPQDCPPKLASLITACWEDAPDKRPDADAIATYLKSEQTDFTRFLPLFSTQNARKRNNAVDTNKASVLPAKPVSSVGSLSIGRDKITISGGIGGQGETIIGGGNHSSSPGPNPKETSELDDIALLKQLKVFFMSNQYKGSESPDCALYNGPLDKHKAVLVYMKDEHVHKLFVNDEAIEKHTDAIKAITQMIESLQTSNTQSVKTTSNVSSATTTQNNTGTQPQIRRDAITIKGGIQSTGGVVRIGGGAHRSFTGYDPFNSQNPTHNMNSLTNSGIKIQPNAAIPKALKFIHHV